MEPDDMTAIADETRRTALNGTRVMLRAYLDANGAERLIWKLGNSVGNDAKLDPSEAHVMLPPGRQVMVDGERISYLHIPRWLCDSLVEDHEELRDANPDVTPPESGIGETETDRAADDDGDDEDFEPMFDSLAEDDE